MLGLTYPAFRQLTFRQLMRLVRAKSDWSEMTAGRNPFISAETREKDRARLLEIAKKRGLTDGKR